MLSFTKETVTASITTLLKMENVYSALTSVLTVARVAAKNAKKTQAVTSITANAKLGIMNSTMSASHVMIDSAMTAITPETTVAYADSTLYF